MRGAGERAVGGSAAPPWALPQATIYPHPHLSTTYQCHRLRKISESTADPRPNAPHSGHQLTPYVQAQLQSQERNTKSQPDKYTKVVPGRSWPSVWARAPNHQGHTNSNTLSCYGTH